MQMHEVEQVKEAHGASAAQKLLDDGWKLIAVVAAGAGNYPIYVLGRSKPAEKKELQVIDPGKLADLGRGLG